MTCGITKNRAKWSWFEMYRFNTFLEIIVVLLLLLLLSSMRNIDMMVFELTSTIQHSNFATFQAMILFIVCVSVVAYVPGMCVCWMQRSMHVKLQPKYQSNSMALAPVAFFSYLSMQKEWVPRTRCLYPIDCLVECFK